VWTQCHLYNRALTRLPDAIGDLSALTTLRLEKLVALEELPGSVGRLAAMQRLEIESCGLKALPTGIAGLAQLEFLSLTDCWKLTHLGEGVGGLQSLQARVLKSTLCSDCIR
jgi:Leucine-rich repeat (LRR) protein